MGTLAFTNRPNKMKKPLDLRGLNINVAYTGGVSLLVSGLHILGFYGILQLQ